mmetsp:Transcript_120115/g.231646  ORF Transcript_120115/g.231646 Transcript_120115/m.231646 type:complete len:223 (-) Transcript_120115:283-951(-)
MRPCTSIYECIEGNKRKLKFQIQHLLIHRPNAVKLLLLSEALQDRAIDDCIDLLAADFILGHVTDELVASLDITVGSKGFDHAAKSDTGWHDVAACPHFMPCVPNPLDILQRPVSTDDASIRVWTLHLHMLDGTLFEMRFQEIWTTCAQASLNNGTEQDFVHVATNVIQKGQDPLQMCRLWTCLDCLQQYSAGDTVWLGTTDLHLINQIPDLLGAFLHSNGQ